MAEKENGNDGGIQLNFATVAWVAYLLSIGAAVWWLSQQSMDPATGPTEGDRIIAWLVKYVLVISLAYTIPPGVWGLLKKSPAQELLFPNADEQRDYTKTIRRKLDNGMMLAPEEAAFLGNTSMQSGMVAIASSIIAGFALLRL